VRNFFELVSRQIQRSVDEAIESNHRLLGFIFRIINAILPIINGVLFFATIILFIALLILPFILYDRLFPKLNGFFVVLLFIAYYTLLPALLRTAGSIVRKKLKTDS
jgi:hypothetical protein